MKMIRWGIIGCGDVTEVKSGPALQKANNSALVAVMRRNGALAADYARRHNVPRWYDDAAALIHDAEVNAVYIATPPSSHKAYTLLAAEAGKPVYVEKPMALNSAECEAMISACRAASVPLFVAYYRRALPRFLQVKKLLESNAIGAVRCVNIKLCQPPMPADTDGNSWRVQPEIAGGGLFVDLAAHTLDLLDYLLGEITEVAGFAANQAGNYAAEDIVTGAFKFVSGAQGIGLWCFTSYEPADYVELVGSRGTLTFATFADQPVTLINADGAQEFFIEHPPHIQQPLIQTVVDELNGTDGACPSNGASAARTTRVMEQMLANYYAA